MYKAYKKGDIMIALDINDKGAKSYALLQSTLAVQTLIMSCTIVQNKSVHFMTFAFIHRNITFDLIL